MARAPVYGLHKPSGQARTTFNGKRVYLGPHGSTESVEKFHEILGRWESARVEGKNPADTKLTVSRLALLFLVSGTCRNRVQQRRPDDTGVRQLPSGVAITHPHVSWLSSYRLRTEEAESPAGRDGR